MKSTIRFKEYAQQKGHLQIRIQWGKQRCQFGTGCTIKAINWDQDQKQLSGMTNHEITTFLGTLQDQVAGESLAKLSAISTSISLPKGTTLMEEGSAHDYFYILVKGMGVCMGRWI